MSRSRNARRLLVAGSVLALAALAAYTVYVGAVGSEEFIHPSDGWHECDTPGVRYGWAYEPINYDATDDAKLSAARAAAGDPTMLQCGHEVQGAPAGDAVVSPDGVRLDGWYIPASDGSGPTGPTIVVVPGYKSNKSEILIYAPAFHRDYNLVVMDLRNQGRSSPAEVTLGLREQHDVTAMVDWLERVKRPAWIAGMGNSMGAATVLAATRADPRIQALVLDSMHARIEVSLGNVLETERGLPEVPAAWAMMTGVSLRLGSDVEAIDPVGTITQIGHRPVLLLHSTTDKVDPPDESAEVNVRAAAAAGVPVELHYCEGLTTGNGSHGRVITQCPDDWTSWANEFLAAAHGT